ncbi:MAG: amidohydrolase [Chloroflexi bacterium]|nr:amidohydrolase [Chloroflexota bacterium]
MTTLKSRTKVKYELISADDHFAEPPDLWTGRLPAKFKANAPRVERTAQGDGWVFPNRPWSPLGLGAQAGRDFKDYRYTGVTYDDVRPGVYESKGRLEDLDLDGVWASVIYPTTGLSLVTIQDIELYTACVRAYNDFCAEFAKADKRRLLPLGIIPKNGVEAALAELDRMRKIGLRGALLSALPSGGDWPTPDDERFWSAAQDLGVVMHIHIGLATRAGLTNATQISTGPQPANPLLPVMLKGYALIAQGAQNAFAGLIFSGVMERYPKLKWVSVESGIGWIPYYLERWDGVFERQRHWANIDLPMKPSDYWRRQVFATFEEDKIGVDLAVRHPEYVGVENLMWASDYPHGDTTWPKSRETVQEHFQGLPQHAKRRMTWDNARELYKIETPAS